MRRAACVMNAPPPTMSPWPAPRRCRRRFPGQSPDKPSTPWKANGRGCRRRCTAGRRENRPEGVGRRVLELARVADRGLEGVGRPGRDEQAAEEQRPACLVQELPGIGPRRRRARSGLSTSPLNNGAIPQIRSGITTRTPTTSGPAPFSGCRGAAPRRRSA